MLIIRLINCLYGYILFTASGGFPERFVNLLSRMSIKAWDIRPHKGVIHGKCRARDYKKLCRAAKKSGMSIQIKKKKGLPFFIKKYRKRLGFFLSVPMFLIFIFVMSGRIWSINFSGNERLSEEYLRQLLRENGISEGIKQSDITASDTESAILSSCDELSWIALNIDGSVLNVEVRESIESLDPLDYTHPCHIVASKDGFLKTLETYEGTKIAKINSAVTKGQLLISGVIEAKDKSITFCHAKGYAAAETTDQLSFEVKKRRNLLFISDYEFRASPEIFNIIIPLGLLPSDENVVISNSEYRLTVNGRRLPVACHKTSLISFQKRSVTLSDKEALLLLMSAMHEKLYSLSKSCEILDCRTVLSNTKDSFKATVNLKLVESIGIESEILTD
ncbi:MAG: sporulation protein YqfD [Clostridia bacterium]|nr:sporulation protein YqfD [Clostridia bacterium]